MSRRTASVARGARGAVAAGHPAGVAAGLAVLAAGGGAVDAAVAAQAALCVALPAACGLGGDAVALVRRPDATVLAVIGAGATPAGQVGAAVGGGASLTVPGIVGAWGELSARFGRLPLADLLAPAVRLAGDGVRVDAPLAAAVTAQRARLVRGGAAAWSLLAAGVGDLVVQPQLADALRGIAGDGTPWFYRGPLAAAVARAAQRAGGALDVDDLREHRGAVGPPVAVSWAGGTAYVPPPPSQGVLLAMALQWLDRHGPVDADLDHVGTELVEAVFAHRDRVTADGARLLAEPLAVDLSRAGRRGGPRAYLHTTGVAVADADGTVVSSLLSLFDDFGSATYVPEGGFVLNNRAAGFTAPPNDVGPRKRPVHTLAPALVELPGGPLGLATPGADGQVQTLLQVLAAMRYADRSLAAAVSAPRWRSEHGRVLLGAGHPAYDPLQRRGHEVVRVDDGDERLGAVVAAYADATGPAAVGDWRRQVAAGGLA